MSLQRERLTVLISEQALTSVDLVIAPPGFGKSTLLRAYAASDDASAYVDVPEAADLETFVRAVVAAAAPSAVRSVGAVFDGASGSELEKRVSEWLVLRLRGFAGTLIIDDFHRAGGDERVARLVTAAVAATRGRMRWLIASREAPRFPMGSWIARGWMGLPIGSDDLRFTTEEAAALAADVGIAATAGELEAIIEDTHGWPIGVRLALDLVKRKRAPAQARTQTRDALFALIGDELWQPLEPELKAVISAAALMPSPAIRLLADAGFTNAQALILRAFERVPFLQPTDDNAFTIHDLFREFVVMQSPPGANADALSMRVAAALVESGTPADGLRLLIAANRTTEILSTLSEHAFELLETGHRAAVLAAADFLTGRGFGDEGVILAVRGAIAVAEGSSSNSTNLFARALQRPLSPRMRCDISQRLSVNFMNLGQTTEALEVLTPLVSDETITGDNRLEIQALTLQILAMTGKHDRNEIALTIDRLERQLAHSGPASQARILLRLGYAAYWSENLEASQRYASDAAQLATELNLETIAALAYGTLYAVANRLDPDTHRAQSYLRSQAGAAERAANVSLRVYALRAEYAIAATAGDHATAEDIEATIETLFDTRTYRDTSRYRLSRAFTYIGAGEFAKAQSTLQSLPAKQFSQSERAFRDSLTTIIHLIRGNRAAAESALERGLVVDASHDYQSWIETTRAYALRGLCFWALDRQAQARKSFDFDANRLPQRDSIVVNALRSVITHQHPPISRDVASASERTLREAGFGAYAILVRKIVELDANDAQLTAAEIQTLREFDRFGGSAAQVAQALGKSRYTVQNQVQSAIRKLGCSGRAEALAYARSRGWLDATSS